MRGVIMEIKNGRAVLLTKGGEFVNIRNKNYSVGDKVNISLNAGRLCAMAASLVIVCAGVSSYFTPAGYVSVDINPSLIMTVNVYNRVIDVKSLNDDARVLLNKTDIKGKSAADSVEMLIKTSEDIGYINDNNQSVILDVVSGIVKPNIENVKYNNIDITKETADMETLRIAQNIGVSVAKAKALEEYTEKNGGDMSSNAAKFNDKSVKEIRKIILDNGDLSDKKADDMPLQNPKPQGDNVSPGKPQQAGGQKSEVTAPSDKQQKEKQKPDTADNGKDKSQAPSKSENGIENGNKPAKSEKDKPQQDKPKKENNAKQTDNVKSGDNSSRDKQPPQSEGKPQNNGGKHNSNKSTNGNSKKP